MKKIKKSVFVKDIQIGGGAPVSVQSMTNTDTENIAETLNCVNRLHDAGAELVRISVPSVKAAEALKEIIRLSPVPIIADVHFDPKLALLSIDAGVHKLRLNPSNIPKTALKDIARAAKERHIPIRVGVNEGSVKADCTPQKLAELCVDTAKALEDAGTDELVLAVKSSDVKKTVLAYRELDKISDYPLHIGLTEAGTENFGSVKSAIAVGALLVDGIGDTLRISLAGDPVKEVSWGIKILRAAGVRKDYIEVIACPTCARTNIDVHAYAEKVEEMTTKYNKPLKIAVMGCAVNGIGESRGAQIGVCGGKERSLLFKDGKPFKEVDNSDVLAELLRLTEEKLGQ